MYQNLSEARVLLANLQSSPVVHGEHQMAQWIADTTTKLNVGLGVPADSAQQLTVDEHNALPWEEFSSRSRRCLLVALGNIDVLLVARPALAGDLLARAGVTVDQLLVATRELARKLTLICSLQ